MNTGAGVSRARFKTRKAEEMRLRALYRSVALSGALALPRRVLLSFVGPDSGYHLYRHLKG